MDNKIAMLLLLKHALIPNLHK